MCQKDSAQANDARILHSIFKMVKLLPGTRQLCEIKSCFLPASQSPTWSIGAFTQGGIGAPLMLESKFCSGISDLCVPARTTNY